MRRSLILLLVVGAAGCGGSSSYGSRADAVCRERAQAVAAIPPPRTPAGQAVAYERLLAAERKEARRLRALAPPHGREREAAALAHAVERVADAAERLRIAALSADSEGAQGAVYQGRVASADVRRYARALGLKVCGG